MFVGEVGLGRPQSGDQQPGQMVEQFRPIRGKASAAAVQQTVAELQRVSVDRCTTDILQQQQHDTSHGGSIYIVGGDFSRVESTT
jgi:hypothetical protein